jgi:murein DD-endopeptidase MepM/ murein hydrolase activator NlpD
VRRALPRALAVVICLASALPASVARAADEPTSAQIRQRLDAIAGRLQDAEVREAELSDDLVSLQRKIAAADAEHTALAEQVAAYARAAYMGGRGLDPTLTLLIGSQSSNALSRVTMLDQAGRQARITMARASALNRQLRVNRADLSDRQAKLTAVRAGLSADGAELDSLFTLVATRESAAAAAAVRLRQVRLAAERAKLERSRLAKQRRASRSVRLSAPDEGDVSDSADPGGNTSDPGPAASGSGYACPAGAANTFRDTWGAPRSGGRRHKGTDIFAPYGSPAYAVTDGVIAGVRSGGLGGLAIILRGDDGDSYYYAHESAIDVHEGERVSVGEKIGAVGRSGNAGDTPAHIHFERWPGGGRPVNPYPFVRRVCG